MTSDVDEQIMSNLSLTEHEETAQFSQSVMNILTKRWRAGQPIKSFQELSDWHNRYGINQTCASPTSSVPRRILKDTLTNTVICRKPLSCQVPKKHPIQIRPINVKFHQKQPKSHQQKYQRNIQFKIRQMTISVYDSNYRPLSQLYQQKVKYERSKDKPSQIVATLNEESLTRQSRFPRTEMISSALRIMKKKQLIKSFRKMNPFLQSPKVLLKQEDAH